MGAIEQASRQQAGFGREKEGPSLRLLGEAPHLFSQRRGPSSFLSQAMLTTCLPF